MSDLIHVTIRQKDKLVWQGQADNLTSTNEIGVFDILPSHSNFIGLVEEYVIIRHAQTEKKYPIDHGILSVKNNQVEIYLGY